MGFPTTVPATMTAALAGMIADTGDTDEVSRVAQATITPGRLVVWHTGDADNVVRHPVSSAEVTAQSIGIARLDVTSLNNPYLAGDMLPALREGRIWVVTEENVTPLSPVFVRFAAGAGGTGLGAFRASADTATAVALPSCRFCTTALAGALVEVQINLP